MYHGSITERIGGVRKYLILVHDFFECDTTSAVHGQGKLSILKLLEKSKATRWKADVFLQNDKTPETICEASIGIFVMLYCGKGSDSLTDLRYLKYMNMVPSSITIKAESLPSIERAAMFDAYFVYFPLHEWNTLADASLVPVMMDKETAPDKLLKIIRCNC